MCLSRDHRGELEIDHQERDPLNHDRRPCTYAAHSSRERPCGAGKYDSYRNVTHVQPDAHPNQTLETRRAGHITEVSAAPGDSRDRGDGEAPGRHLNRKMLEQWRLKSAHHHSRESSRAAEDGETRPEQETQQMLLLGAKKRIGPHACDASRTR